MWFWQVSPEPLKRAPGFFLVRSQRPARFDARQSCMRLVGVLNPVAWNLASLHLRSNLSRISLLSHYAFFPRLSISSAKRSRRRGQGDRLRSTYWHSSWLHCTNRSVFDSRLNEGLFFRAISTSSDTTVQK